MTRGFDKRGYWEKKILAWELSRYSGNAWLRPASWTLRRRMDVSVAIARQALPRGGRMLELGCGSGLLAERLLGHYGAYQGIDFAESAIREARCKVTDPAAAFVCADVLEAELPPADLTVFLGLLDWLEPAEIERLFGRLRSPKLLFSFTERPRVGLNPYALYRSYYDRRFGKGVYAAHSFSLEEVTRWVGKGRATLSPSRCLDPGRLVLVEDYSAGKA